MYDDPEVPWTGNIINMDDNLTFVGASEGAAEERLGVDGKRRAAFPIRYYVDHLATGRLGPIAVAWVDAANGSLAQTETPSYQWSHGRPSHQAQFTKTDRPAFYGVGAIWGQTLTKDTVWNASLRVEVAASAPETVADVRQGFMALQVQRIRPSEDGCIAIVDLVHQDRANPIVTRLTLQDGLPVPTHVHEWSQSWDDMSHTRLELKKFTSGKADGPNFPAFDPQPLPARGLTTLPGLFSDSGTVFNTSFQDAQEAVMRAPGPDAWFEEHEEALLSYVRHQLAGENTGVRDRWSLEWSTPTGNGIYATIVNQSSALPGPAGGLDEQLVVDWELKDGLAYGPELAETTSLVAFDNLLRDVYGEPLEVINCRVAASRCAVGSHAVVEYPRYLGNQATSFPVSGIIVWVQTGLMLQEESRGWDTNL